MAPATAIARVLAGALFLTSAWGWDMPVPSTDSPLPTAHSLSYEKGKVALPTNTTGS
ncbi:MAG: hypothetical protein QOD56_1808 [Gammaproteobacteria bacterium]|jgi:hypothetical protein|nr:hypothetical protein [Gammaproteobacteria bacterium]